MTNDNQIQRRTRSGGKAALVIAAAALAASACGSASAESVTTVAPGTTVPAVTTTLSAPVPTTVEVSATDYGFGGLPATIKAGTVITLVNESDVELHEFVAIPLPQDESRSVSELIESPDDLVALFPAVATVLIAPPGGGDAIPAVGDGSLNEPGRYAIICAIPTGADPAEYLAAAAESEGPPDVAGGPPHFVQGMYAEVTVTE